MDDEIIVEGSTKLAVPYNLAEPKMLPAFFNPRGKFVRDVSIFCYEAFFGTRKDATFADALSGVGARGIRVANEVNAFGSVFLNDTNSKAIEFGKKSAELNGVVKKCSFSKSEACAFLLSRDSNSGDRFDCVDIDPFGTPSNYVDCGIRAVKDGGMLSVTATDTAVLCGVYPKVAERKYLGLPLRNDYSHEVGMRLVFGLLSMNAMRFEAGITPLFCHHDMHYFRTYCEINVGNSHSKSNQKEIGYVLHCFQCSYRQVLQRESFFSSKKELHEQTRECPVCSKHGKNAKLAIGGPCWIGKIQSVEFVKRLKERNVGESLFEEEELDIPLYYDLSALSQKIGKRTPRINDTIERLRSQGYLASRTRLNHDALRTDAGIEVLLELLRELAR